MRIFIGLTEVSGYYSRLKSGFDEIGVRAEFYPLQLHRFCYGGASTALPPRFAQYCVRNRVDALSTGGVVRRSYWLLLVLASRIIFFVWAMARFDVFLLGGGSSFFGLYELPLIRLLGRRVVYTFHGTDSRPAWMDGFCEGVRRQELAPGGREMPPTPEELTAIRSINKLRRRNVRWIERFANVTVNAPPQAQFHTRPYVIGLRVGLPVNALPVPAVPPRKASGRVRIVHSPSFHVGKGTVEIRGAIDELRAEGLEIDYVEISNRPNLEVREEIERCDFVVDQVFSDTPMAGFAAEAALASKPAVVAGYYSAYVWADLGSENCPPSLYCPPAELKDAIRRLVVDVKFRERLGNEARKFVLERWSPKAVAKRYLRLIQGDVPEEWLYEPARNTYFHGMGMNEYRLAEVVSQYVSAYGIHELGLHPNERLRELVEGFLDQVASSRSGTHVR